jgi:apolipoprotein D and lipocalin family protein
MRFKHLIALCAPGLLSACSLMPAQSFPRENSVDVDRYMGKWYVIAHIPPGMTKNAYNSIERYEQTEPGRIETTFTYREGGFDGEAQKMEPTGFVLEGGNGAVWGMRFFWPIKMQYVISYVDADYETTIVAREKRDYVWIMARTPQIEDATYDTLVQKVADYGYDISKLRKVPQQPLDQRDDG